MRPTGDPAKREAPDQPSSDRHDAARQRLGTAPACPFCGSTDTEELSAFASQLSTSQYLCRACHSPFEHFKR